MIAPAIRSPGREIAVVIINGKWHSIYPTNAHEPAGKAAGLPTDKIEALLSSLPWPSLIA